jgi:hypothetical protein
LAPSFKDFLMPLCKSKHFVPCSFWD